MIKIAIRYKSALCQNFEKFGFCGYEDNCEFAHGKEVDHLRTRPTTMQKTGWTNYSSFLV